MIKGTTYFPELALAAQSLQSLALRIPQTVILLCELKKVHISKQRTKIKSITSNSSNRAKQDHKTNLDVNMNL